MSKIRAVTAGNTSRTCPCCGHVSADNRQSQERFTCMECEELGTVPNSSEAIARIDELPEEKGEEACLFDLKSWLARNLEELERSIGSCVCSCNGPLDILRKPEHVATLEVR